MSQGIEGITRRSLAKNLLLAVTTFAFPVINNKWANPNSTLKVVAVDDHFVSINGWVVAKSDLLARGKNQDAG